jgi:hypothetical protein
MRHILISGGSGFIGSHLVVRLLQRHSQVTVLSRQPERYRHQWPSEVRWIASLDNLLEAPDVVVNLAGAPLPAHRWTKAYRREIMNSRVEGTRQLVHWLNQNGKPDAPLLSGSAVGWYGDRGDEELDEASPPGQGFAAELCQCWEHAANAYSKGRVILLRTGIVLGRGGALAQMRLPYLIGLGGSLAGGQQFWPWIHMDDYLDGLLHLMDNENAAGPYNLVGANPVRQGDFAKTLAAVFHRPALLPMPGWLLRLSVGQMAELLLASQRCVPRKLLEEGWACRHPSLTDALRDILSKWS